MRYFFRSLFTLLTLYGVVLLAADFAMFRAGMPLAWAIALANGLFLLKFFFAPKLIELFLGIDWDDDRTLLPARNREFLETLCREQGIPVPRVGMVWSAAPNAFTFGRFRSDARVVVSKGLLDSLTPEEVNAVIAHELGHIKHWDFLVITIASLAPLFLYWLHTLIRVVSDRDGIASWLSYAAYWLGEFLVLGLSRTREFYADDFAARACGNPNDLSSALVKISYGLAKLRNQHEYQERARRTKKEAPEQGQPDRTLGAIGVLGIARADMAFGLTGAQAAGGAAAAMAWDLKNPWAHIYEIASTHPTTARRVRALNRVSEQSALPVAYEVDSGARTQWSLRFVLELALWATPAITFAAFWVAMFCRGRLHWAIGNSTFYALAVATLACWGLRIWYRYQGQPAATATPIRTLLANTEVSNMLPVAVRLEGKIVGRGEEEAFWSPDLVIQDETGMLYMLDRQTIPFARLAAVSNADEFVGRQVVIEGWFRRGPMPYVEMSSIRTNDAEDPQLLHESYSRSAQFVLAVVVVAAWSWFVISRMK